MAQQDILSTDTLPQGRTKINANSAEVQDHLDNTSNPHGVTAAQVGAMTEAETQAALNAKQAAGGVWFDGESAGAQVDALQRLWENGGTFSFSANVIDPVVKGDSEIIFDTRQSSAAGWAIICNSGTREIQINHQTTGTVVAAVCPVIPAWGTDQTITLVWDGSVDGSAPLWYFDGVLQGASTPVVTATGDLGFSTNGAWIGRNSQSATNFLEGKIYYIRAFNRTLSAAEVQTLYDHGGALPAGPEWRWGDVTALTSGTLEPDAWYRINTYVAGDDFANVGAANASGEEFQATGTTPTTWANSSELEKIGAISALPMDEGAGPVLHDVSPNGYHATLSGGYKHLLPNTQTETIAIAVGDETTDLTTGTAKTTFRMPYGFQLYAVRASVTTAPDGSALQVDVNASGTSIFSTVLSVDASEKTSTTAATAAVLSTVDISDDEEITIDIDQVGSTTAGAGLKVYFIGRRTS